MKAVIGPIILTLPAIAVTLLCALLSIQTMELSVLLTLQLLLILHPLYYWSVFRPALFPYWAAFLIGFIFDFWSSTLLGFHALLFLLISLLLNKQRRFLLSQSFVTQWALFLALCLSVEVARWCVMSALHMTAFPLAAPLVSAVMNAALYPIVTLVMIPCHRLLSARISDNSLS